MAFTQHPYFTLLHPTREHFKSLLNLELDTTGIIFYRGTTPFLSKVTNPEKQRYFYLSSFAPGSMWWSRTTSRIVYSGKYTRGCAFAVLALYSIILLFLDIRSTGNNRNVIIGDMILPILAKNNFISTLFVQGKWMNNLSLVKNWYNLKQVITPTELLLYGERWKDLHLLTTFVHYSDDIFPQYFSFA